MKDAPETKETKLGIVDVWEDFVGSTGFHSVNKILFNQRKHPIYRSILWLFLWLLSAGYVTYIVYTEMNLYFSYPFTTSVTVKREDSLEFPVITICNLSSKNKSAFPNANDTENEQYYFSTTSSFNKFINVNWSNPYYENNGFFKERTWDDFKAESKNVTSLVSYQLFDFKENVINFTEVATDIGLCVRGNYFNTVTTDVYGGIYNLQLYLDLQLNDDYFPSQYFSSGVKVAIHEKDVSPLMMDEGFFVPPASDAYVEISREQFKLLPSPYLAFEDEMCEVLPETFSITECMSTCIQNQILRICGCVDFMFESDNGTYCSKEKYATCFLPEYWNILKTGLSVCRCPRPCEGVNYRTSVTFGQFPSEFMVAPLARMLNVNQNHMRTNYIGLKIYFKSLSTEITQQVPKYSNVGDVFSNIGGQLGLFLGASFLTLAELGEFMLFLIWYLLIRIFKRNIVVSSDNKVYISKEPK